MPQLISLPEKSDHIELIIESVYPGSHYNDTCIAGIFTSMYSDNIQ